MNTIPPKPFILIDGSSYLYRAFYALPPLTNSKGQATGAIFGVINMIRKLMKTFTPEHVGVVFDAKGKTFRDELFKAYKAQRPPMPDALREQITPLQEIIQAMGLPLIIIEGVEADDVIATLALQAADRGMHTLISTGDKDMAQIVNGKITLINTMSNTLLDAQGVLEKFGVPPEKIVDYLALVGDKVDNIPGIPNVGPKTAVKWLNEYGSLDEVIKNAEHIKGKVGENLVKHLDHLALSRQLATVKHDVELPFKPEDLNPRPTDRQKLLELYSRMEFRSLLAEQLETAENNNNSQCDYKTILTQEDLNRWLERLRQADVFAVDTETNSMNYMNAEIVGLSFAVKPDEAVYIPVAHDYPEAPPQLSREAVLEKLKPLLEDTRPKKIGQNLKYDKTVFAHHGIELQGIAYDTMLESYVLNSSAARHDMDSLALKYLSHRTIHFEDVAGKGAKQKTFNQVELKAATHYAAEDADITLKLHQTLWPKIQEEKGLREVFLNIEMPLLSVLSRMERCGVLIDEEKLVKQGQEISLRLQMLEQQAYELAGQSFNMASPKQLQEILFEKLRLPVLQKTPTGQPSTAEAVLQELALDYPLPSVILEYRSLAKLKSTYIEALPRQINPKTGRVHTSYNQAVTATGRLSSTEPNLQNIPVRTEEGRRIRQAFIAAPGCRIVAADYSQIELRIMAHLSRDQGLQEAFRQGQDIHRATAAEVFGVALDQVTPNQRRNAKAINFGLIYGMSAYGLSRQLGIDGGTAQNYIDLYFQRYPGVKQYMEDTRRQAHKNGYVETLYGRRLYLPEIQSSNLQRRRAAERAAINAPMQGTAADIIKLAMIAMDEYLQQSELAARMMMQVHDELVFEVAESDAEALVQQIKILMVKHSPLTVPLLVDTGIGANWEEAH